MNEPSNQTGLNDTFSSQPASQTNPFTADLKGEFTSNFGTNTNAVSQIFKEGGFVGNNRTKYLALGGIVVVFLALIYYLVSGDESGEEEIAATDPAAEESKEDEVAEEAEEAKPAEKPTAVAEEKPAEAPAPAPASVAKPAKGKGFAIGSGAIALTEPADGASVNYDETQGPAVFSWQGGGGYIVFSRSQSMKPAVFRIPVNGNSYDFHHPWPGTWYWKVENKSGSTDVRRFTVSGPARRNVQITAPASGASLAGTGGTVTWQGDSNVAYYRVELTNGGWANPPHRFASSGNSVNLNGVAPGQYQMRVGAFSEVSGRWEYTAPVQVTVQ